MTDHKPAKSAMHQRFAALTGSAPEASEDRGATWFEPEMIEILHRPAPPGRSREEHAAKELELMTLFERLAVIEAWTLHKRLACAAGDDRIVIAFARLIPERRARLLAFLGDARRRAAIRAA